MKYIDEMSKALADKPGPKDPRRTPAPKKDQKKGSKKKVEEDEDYDNMVRSLAANTCFCLPEQSESRGYELN